MSTLIWCEDEAIRKMRTGGPSGPGFERDLLIQVLGHRSHDAVLERTDVIDYGRHSWRWRILIDGNCVAMRLTKAMGESA